MRSGIRNFQGDLESGGTSMKILLGNVSAFSGLGNEILTKDINPANLLLNGSFEYWYAGTSSVPDAWALAGSGSIARESTIVKLGTYSAKLTNTVSNLAFLYNTNYNTSSWYLDKRGKTFTLSVWIKTSTASRVRIAIKDSVGNNFSDYHTGGGDWELLTVTRIINASATLFMADVCEIDTGSSIDVYLDGAMLVEGGAPFAFDPNLEDHLYKPIVTGINASDALVGDTDDDYNAIVDFANGHTWPKNINKNVIIPVYFPSQLYNKDVVIDAMNMAYYTDISASYIDRVQLLQRRTSDSTVITLFDHTDNLGQGTTGLGTHELVDSQIEIENDGYMYLVVTMGGCTAADDAKVLSANVDYHIKVHDS